MISDILKAFRDALVADAPLLALVPAANVYAGLRDEKTAIPGVDISIVSEVSENYAGSRVGGMTKATTVIQISVFARNDSDALAIAGRSQEIVLSDNTTLNAAKIKNLTMIGRTSLRVGNLIHVPTRFRLNYHFIVS